MANLGRCNWQPINQLPPSPEKWSRQHVFRDEVNNVYMGTYIDINGQRLLSPLWLRNADVVDGLKVQ